ncbi:helix-turn-helix transcriptional regulator [Thauera mechernichensis]
MSAKRIAPIFLDLPAVVQAVALSESTVQELVRQGQFPAPRQLSGRRVGWLVRELEAWAESRPVSQLLPPPNTGAPKPRPRKGDAAGVMMVQ